MYVFVFVCAFVSVRACVRVRVGGYLGMNIIIIMINCFVFGCTFSVFILVHVARIVIVWLLFSSYRCTALRGCLKRRDAL